MFLKHFEKYNEETKPLAIATSTKGSRVPSISRFA